MKVTAAKAARPGQVSFVISSRDEDPEVVSRTVRGLIATSAGYDRSVIVVDDASKSPIDYLPDSVLVVRNNTPLGVSRARREGCALADGEVLVSLDAHHTFAPGWLDRLLEHVGTGAVLCPSVANYDRTSRVIYGADLGWVGNPAQTPNSAPGFYLTHRYHQGAGAVFDVPSVTGACYVMSRVTYDRLGGFSPMFRVWGCDEQDISLRAHLAGIRVLCVANALVGHLYRSAFPYSGVTQDVVNYNLLVMIGTIFGDSTAARLQRAFRPLSSSVVRWLDATDLRSWRAVVRRQVALSDRALLAQAGVRRPW